MIFIKTLLFSLIIGISALLGYSYSKKYVNRVEELKMFKSALVMLKTKIRYTYAPLNEIFNDIAESIKGNLAILFRNACKHIEEKGATEGFNIAIETTELNVTKEDKQVMKSLSKLLGKTDVEGQINEIELTETFLDTQIEKAEIERQKNAKLYQTLGVICGLGLVIILL